jgi:hypothetical protein
MAKWQIEVPEGQQLIDWIADLENHYQTEIFYKEDILTALKNAIKIPAPLNPEGMGIVEASVLARFIGGDNPSIEVEVFKKDEDLEKFIRERSSKDLPQPSLLSVASDEIVQHTRWHRSAQQILHTETGRIEHNIPNVTPLCPACKKPMGSIHPTGEWTCRTEACKHFDKVATIEWDCPKNPLSKPSSAIADSTPLTPPPEDIHK